MKGSNLAHAKYYSPSGAKGWSKCAAIAIIKAHGNIIKQTPHVNTSMGTLTHGASEAVLRGEIKDCREHIGRKLDLATFGELNAREGDQYVAYIRAILAQYPDAILMVEQRLYYGNQIGAVHSEAFGSGDAIIYVPSQRTLWVIDLKTGAISVEIENNEQLMIYMCAAYDYFNCLGPVDTIVGVIWQRAAYEWAVSPEIPQAYVRSLRPQAKKIKEGARIFVKTGELPKSFYTPGYAQCKWCPVLDCPYQMKAGDKFKTKNINRKDRT